MASTEVRTFTVQVHHEDDGSLWAEVDGLPGCFASGFDMNELRESLQEAIGLYLSTESELVEFGEARLGAAEPTVERRERRELTLCAV